MPLRTKTKSLQFIQKSAKVNIKLRHTSKVQEIVAFEDFWTFLQKFMSKGAQQDFGLGHLLEKFLGKGTNVSLKNGWPSPSLSRKIKIHAMKS